MDDWDDDFGSAPLQGGAADPLVDTEYARIQQRYTDAGYREGITDGKLATLQEGFDVSFASSVPPARRMGVLRGRVNALLAIVSAPPPTTARGARGGSTSAASASSPVSTADSTLVERARALVADMSRVRRDEVLPVDEERLAHEREEHADDDQFELASNPQRDMEGLEDALGRLGGGGSAAPSAYMANGAPLREAALLDALEARVNALEREVLGQAA